MKTITNLIYVCKVAILLLVALPGYTQEFKQINITRLDYHVNITVLSSDFNVPVQNIVVVDNSRIERTQQGVIKLYQPQVIPLTYGAMSRFALQKCLSYRKCYWQTCL